MKSIYICNTHFQLISIINLAASNKEYKNILLINTNDYSMKLLLEKNKYLLKNFTVYHEFYNFRSRDINLKVLKIFKRIVLYQKNKNEFKKLYKKIKLSNTDKIYIGSSNKGNDIINLFLYKLKINKISFSVIEDGVGTYLALMKAKNNKKKSKNINVLNYLFNYIYLDYNSAETIYFSNTEIGKLYNKDYTINYIKFNINKILKYSPIHINKLISKINQYRYIVINQIPIYDNQIRNILSKMSIQKDLIYFRMHPSQLNSTSNMLDYQLWELISKFLNEKIIIITMNSTAGFTPYFLHGKKNKVIFINEFTVKNVLFSTFLHRIPKFNKHFFLPSNLDDFKSLLT